MDSTSKTSKPRRKYFSDKFSQRNHQKLQFGFKGFLCTFNGMEVESIREAYTILNKANELLSSKQEPTESEDNIEEELKQEIASLQAKEHLFNRIDVGAKNVFFIHSKTVDPLFLGSKLVEFILNNKIRQTKFVIRVIPTQIVCKAALPNIKESVEPLIKADLLPGKSFSIEFTHRNNNAIKKEDIINEIVPLCSADNKVDLKNAEVSIVIDIIKTFAFVSVISDYLKFKKYNLSNLNVNVDIANNKTD